MAETLRLAATAPIGSGAMDAADLVFAGIARQAQMIRDGEVSPTELVQACLDRIEALDPQLNAWRVVLAERALAEAGQAEGRRGAGDDRPLLGVPIGVKDDLRVAGTTTAWGIARPRRPESPDDADVVARLRDAGAIVLGKTNVPEMTIWPFTETETFGKTRNPWDTARTPGGSSGGSGAAVASGHGRRRARAPTAAARSGSRRPGAACSGSSRAAARCRSPRTTTPGRACRSTAR